MLLTALAVVWIGFSQLSFAQQTNQAPTVDQVYLGRDAVVQDELPLDQLTV